MSMHCLKFTPKRSIKSKPLYAVSHNRPVQADLNKEGWLIKKIFELTAFTILSSIKRILSLNFIV
jgi:hypothetical protein